MSHDWLEAVINNSNNHCLAWSKASKGNKSLALALMTYSEREKGKVSPSKRNIRTKACLSDAKSGYFCYCCQKLSSGLCCGEASYKYLVIETVQTS